MAWNKHYASVQSHQRFSTLFWILFAGLSSAWTPQRVDCLVSIEICVKCLFQKHNAAATVRKSKTISQQPFDLWPDALATDLSIITESLINHKHYSRLQTRGASWEWHSCSVYQILPCCTRLQTRFSKRYQPLELELNPVGHLSP